MNHTSQTFRLPSASTAVAAFDGIDAPAAIAWSLCGVKVALALAASWFVVAGGLGWVSVVLGLAIAADILDGIIFSRSRLSNNKKARDQRRVADTVTDRFLLISALVPLVLLYSVPTWFWVAVLARELTLAAVVIAPYLSSRHVLRPNLMSRFASALIGLQIIAFTYSGTANPAVTAVWLVIAAAGISQYMFRPAMN